MSDREGRVALAAVLIAAFVALLDTTIVNVALPAMCSSLGRSDTMLEWVVAGYTLAFGLILVPAGFVGDRWSIRNVFLVGLAAFVVTSVGAGLCGTPVN